MMTAEQLWFVNPYQLEVRAQQLPPLQAGQMRVHSVCSGISAGTEMLVYRGQLPSELAVDATLEGLQMQANYPLPYGYACVGRVEALGEGVAACWMGQLVFAFQTHASAFITTPEQVIKVPEDINPEAAIFLANMETAVNMVLDGQPSLGEQVVAELKKHFPAKMFDTIVPRNIRLAEAPSHGKPISEYDKYSKGSQAYKKLAREIEKRLNK